MFKKISFLILLSACAHDSHSPLIEGPNYAAGEIILSTMLLINIHDGVMPPMDCVANQKEAEILLRVIRPRMDEIDAKLDGQLNSQNKRMETLNKCLDNCSCPYLELTLRDSKIKLTKNEEKSWAETLQNYKTQRATQCLSYIQQSFCGSALQLELDHEKVDFISTEE